MPQHDEIGKIIKSPIQSTVYHFTKGKDLDLDKKIEGLACMCSVARLCMPESYVNSTQLLLLETLGFPYLKFLPISAMNIEKRKNYLYNIIFLC